MIVSSRSSLGCGTLRSGSSTAGSEMGHMLCTTGNYFIAFKSFSRCFHKFLSPNLQSFVLAVVAAALVDFPLFNG